MAKKATATADQTTDATNSQTAEFPEVAMAVLNLPTGENERPGYLQEQIDSGDLMLQVPGMHFNAHVGPRGAAAFARLRNGLIQRFAKTGDGRLVRSNADALRWLCEALADAQQIS